MLTIMQKLMALAGELFYRWDRPISHRHEQVFAAERLRKEARQRLEEERDRGAQRDKRYDAFVPLQSFPLDVGHNMIMLASSCAPQLVVPSDWDIYWGACESGTYLLVVKRPDEYEGVLQSVRLGPPSLYFRWDADIPDALTEERKGDWVFVGLKDDMEALLVGHLDAT